jgi:hypothetical protein
MACLKQLAFLIKPIFAGCTAVAKPYRPIDHSAIHKLSYLKHAYAYIHPPADIMLNHMVDIG